MFCLFAGLVVCFALRVFGSLVVFLGFCFVMNRDGSFDLYRSYASSLLGPLNQQTAMLMR